MRPFFVKLYVATLLVHVAFAAVLVRLGALVDLQVPWWGALLVALGLAGAFHGRLQLGLWDAPISRWRRWLVEEPYYVHWCALLLAPALLVAVAPGLSMKRSGGLSLLAEWPLWSDAWLGSYLIGVVVAGYGVVMRRRWTVVRRVSIAVTGLDPAFDRFRIVQLSDLHLGSHCPRERVARWVRRANALEPDLIALTGDYVTSGVRFHEDIAAALGELRAREGVLAVMGNHDYFGEGEPLMGLMRQQGITLLRNEHLELERDGARLALAGVDDIYTGRIDIEAALAGRDEAIPMVVLAHDPTSFPKLARRGAALVLSGHTHWGQVAVPFFAERLNYNALHMRHHAGHYRLDDAQLYVSSGLGTTGPPIRLGAPPEIAVIELRVADP